uniref:UBA-like domain-containing protein n=1 Tax=Scylla olivacea TaxID=85551 RepID=A0A0P4WDA6_SCYOL
MERQREHREEINLSGDSDDDDNVPDVATCQKLVEQFAELTNTDEACAQFYLQDRQWDLESDRHQIMENNCEYSTDDSLKESLYVADPYWWGKRHGMALSWKEGRNESMRVITEDNKEKIKHRPLIKSCVLHKL